MGCNILARLVVGARVALPMSLGGVGLRVLLGLLSAVGWTTC